MYTGVSVYIPDKYTLWKDSEPLKRLNPYNGKVPSLILWMKGPRKRFPESVPLTPQLDYVVETRRPLVVPLRLGRSPSVERLLPSCLRSPSVVVEFSSHVVPSVLVGHRL